MSEECGRTTALAAGRTRKGAGEEGLVSAEGLGCPQDWPWGGGAGRRAAVPALLPGPSWPLLQRTEGGVGSLAGLRGGQDRKTPGVRKGQGSAALAGAWPKLVLGEEGENRNLKKLWVGLGGQREGRGGGGGARVGRWDAKGRRDLEPPAPRGFLQVSPEGAGDEDSCSSSAPLSPSSSPRSMASGSGCPPGKCVCNSCGLEIVDKYLLKVRQGIGREAQGDAGLAWELWEKSNVPPTNLSVQVLDGGCRFSQKISPVQGNSCGEIK